MIGLEVITNLVMTIENKTRLIIALAIYGVTLVSCALARFGSKVSLILASVTTALWAIH
jgi:hypothetical protein